MSILAAYVVPHPPLIIPSVGKGQEKAIAQTIHAYQAIAQRCANHCPETVVVVSPHAPAYADCFCVSTEPELEGSLTKFVSPQTKFFYKNDLNFVQALASAAAQERVPLVGSTKNQSSLDHATFIPLWYLEQAGCKASVVSIGLSGLSSEEHKRLGELIAKTATQLNRRVVLIASGDLSHKLKADGPYGLAPEGEVFDREITHIFDSGDLAGLFGFDATFLHKAAECGLGSFQIMAGALDKIPCTHELMSYEGSFGVGYATAAFESLESPNNAPLDRQAYIRKINNAGIAHLKIDPYVRLARYAVEQFVTAGNMPSLLQDLPLELREKQAGVFVSLHKFGQLRGCIGTISPVTGCVGEEVIRNAISAATQDPRFEAVRPSELDDLTYSVDVLYPPMPIASASELDPKKYGVIVTKGFRRGLLLPNLEGVETVEQQLAIAKQKAGIDSGDTDVELERFEVVRHDRGGQSRNESKRS